MGERLYDGTCGGWYGGLWGPCPGPAVWSDAPDKDSSYWKKIRIDAFKNWMRRQGYFAQLEKYEAFERKEAAARADAVAVDMLKKFFDPQRIDKMLFDTIMYAGKPQQFVGFELRSAPNPAPITPEPLKHRKVHAIVKKDAEPVKTANEIANEHASEAIDMIQEARDILSAADKFTGMYVYDVDYEADGYDDDDEVEVKITLKKIDADQSAERSNDFIDKALFGKYDALMQTLATTLQGVLQQTGRTLLADATLSMHRLAAPELKALAAQASASQTNAKPAA